ncbi:hypothetical protein HY641_01155 [Candidatus Woesearchaeota archaeon]|nr:hypothetical protein [Candidatus Woesearchaeota archaeon]
MDMRIGFILLVLCATPALASWEDHTGTTQWKVDITERGCGTDETESYLFVINHKGPRAEIADPVHGRTTGTFEGDILKIPSRILPDGVGSSRLSPITVPFTCTIFTTEYRWDYKDQHVSCSGTTEWRGHRIDQGGCPQQPTTTQRVDIKEHLTREDKARAILAKNPKDFWANWDMAHANKQRGDYKEYLTYLNKATSNEYIYPETRAKVQQEALKQLGLPQPPPPGTVPFLRVVTDEADAGGVIYNLNVPKPTPQHKQRWRTMLWAALTPKSDKILKDLAGLPGDEE